MRLEISLKNKKTQMSLFTDESCLQIELMSCMNILIQYKLYHVNVVQMSRQIMGHV